MQLPFVGEEEVVGYDKPSWSQIGRLSVDPTIYGTKGTISFGPHETMVFTKDKQEGEAIAVDPLPQGERNAVEYFLTRIKEDRPIEGMCDPKFSRDVQEVLEAGLISSKSGTVTMIPLNEDR